METYVIDVFDTGLAVAVLAWVWLVVRAFQQHAWWGLGSLFLPPLALLFAIRHPHRAVGPLVASFVGFIGAAGALAYWLVAPVDVGLRARLSQLPTTVALAWNALQSDAAHEWMERRAFYMQLGGIAVAGLALVWLSWHFLRRSWGRKDASVGDRAGAYRVAGGHGGAVGASKYAPTARRGHRAWILPALIVLSLLVAAAPALYTLYVPLNLGPRETLVDGQRHITLTGWDRDDYSMLKLKSDVVVLQMANRDVTDKSLENLKEMKDLKELDLSDTQVTDAGLAVLKDLPALATLRLARTKITDEGFRKAISAKDSLERLDVSKTAVRPETIKEWRDAKPGRRALQ